jgi:hypothetical protein
MQRWINIISDEMIGLSTRKAPQYREDVATSKEDVTTSSAAPRSTHIIVCSQDYIRPGLDSTCHRIAMDVDTGRFRITNFMVGLSIRTNTKDGPCLSINKEKFPGRSSLHTATRRHDTIIWRDWERTKIQEKLIVTTNYIKIIIHVHHITQISAPTPTCPSSYFLRIMSPILQTLITLTLRILLRLLFLC